MTCELADHQTQPITVKDCDNLCPNDKSVPDNESEVENNHGGDVEGDVVQAHTDGVDAASSHHDDDLAEKNMDVVPSEDKRDDDENALLNSDDHTRDIAGDIIDDIADDITDDIALEEQQPYNEEIQDKKCEESIEEPALNTEDFHEQEEIKQNDHDPVVASEESVVNDKKLISEWCSFA